MSITWQDVVVLERPYGLSEKEMTEAKEVATELSGNLYDRQKEFLASDCPGAILARKNKIHTGIISELVMKHFLDSSTKGQIEIVYGGLLNGHTCPDEFDFAISGKTVDIKSSIEKNKTIICMDNREELIRTILTQRNFTLPIDQGQKDFIFQIIYVGDKALLCGAIQVKELAKQENIRDLVLNNGQIQKTYMKKLVCGQSLQDILKICLRGNALNSSSHNSVTTDSDRTDER